jgi:two-component system, OmpR family, response regulator
VKVLVVEDDEPLAQALQRGLVDQGFEVDIVGDGNVALDRPLDTTYDVIVLDLMLPGLNGYRVISELRARNDWTPILVLTAKQGEFDQTEVLDSGADDFLSKPFSFPVLVAHLRALARRRKNGTTNLTAGDLTLDTRQHRCWRGAAEIPLTRREFALLEMLMRRLDEAIPKQELLDDVWDYAFDGDANIVEVYVGYLRSKIDRPFEKASLETVRGVGYRLRGDGG